MAKNKSKRKPAKPARIPEVGDVYLAVIKPGVFGAMRVLQSKRAGRKWDYLVATSPWHGTTRPCLDEPALRKVLCLTHHSWVNSRQTQWVADGPPSDWELLGNIKPTRKESKENCTTYGYWVSDLDQVLVQYRWDHDREALLAEEAREDEEEERQSDEEAQARVRRFEKMTLEQFRRRRRFVDWSSFAQLIALRESRRILRETIDELIPLNPPQNKRRVLKTLHRCVEQLNQMEADHSCLATIECDDLVTELYNLFCVCGLANDATIIDDWVDW